MIQQFNCREKLDTSHSQGIKGSKYISENLTTLIIAILRRHNTSILSPTSASVCLHQPAKTCSSNKISHYDYYPRIAHFSHQNKGNDHQLRKLFIVKQILHACIVFQKHVIVFQLMKKRYHGLQLLNEYGDLYFSLHNFGVLIIPFKVKK